MCFQLKLESKVSSNWAQTELSTSFQSASKALPTQTEPDSEFKLNSKVTSNWAQSTVADTIIWGGVNKPYSRNSGTRWPPPKLILVKNPISVEISFSVDNSKLSSTPVLQFTATWFLLYFCGFLPNHFYSCAVTQQRREEVAACFEKGSKDRLQPGADLFFWGAGK